MNLVRRVVEVLVERFVALVGSLFAARIETVAALMHAEQQDELEERARQFEEDGKKHLADDLRSRASQLALTTPKASGHEVLRHLQDERAQLEMPRIAQTPGDSDDHPGDSESPEPTVSRPSRRRVCRRPQTD